MAQNGAQMKALTEYLARELASEYEVGKDLFGRLGSGDGSLSVRRHDVYAELVNAKRRRRRALRILLARRRARAASRVL